VALDEALIDLTRIDPRKAQIVEMRFFGGLTVEEIGEVLKVSTGTIKRDWRAAYDDLLTLWKNADPDIPVLKQARAEYARLP